MTKYPTEERNCKTCAYSTTFKVIGKKSEHHTCSDYFTGYSCEKQKIYLTDRTACCCPKYSKELTLEEWAEKNEGKPISEWLDLPKDTCYVQYSNGIVITSVKNFGKMVRERAEEVKR